MSQGRCQGEVRFCGNIYGGSKRDPEGETREARVSQPDKLFCSHYIPSLMHTHDWLFSRHGGRRCDVFNRWEKFFPIPTRKSSRMYYQARGLSPFQHPDLIYAHMPQTWLTVWLFHSFHAIVSSLNICYNWLPALLKESLFTCLFCEFEKLLFRLVGFLIWIFFISLRFVG